MENSRLQQVICFTWIAQNDVGNRSLLKVDVRNRKSHPFSSSKFIPFPLISFLFSLRLNLSPSSQSTHIKNLFNVARNSSSIRVCQRDCMNFHHRLEKSEESGTTSVYKSCAVKNVPLVPVQSLLFILTKGALLKTKGCFEELFKLLFWVSNIKLKQARKLIDNVYK